MAFVGKVRISGFIPEARKPQQCLLEAIALRPENVCRICEILAFSPILSSLLTDSWRYFTKEHALNSIWFISAGGIVYFQPANGEKANVETVFLSRDWIEELLDSCAMGQLRQSGGSKL